MKYLIVWNILKILYRINNDNLEDDKEEENVKDKYKFETEIFFIIIFLIYFIFL